MHKNAKKYWDSDTGSRTRGCWESSHSWEVRVNDVTATPYPIELVWSDFDGEMGPLRGLSVSVLLLTSGPVIAPHHHCTRSSGPRWDDRGQQQKHPTPQEIWTADDNNRSQELKMLWNQQVIHLYKTDRHPAARWQLTSCW